MMPTDPRYPSNTMDQSARAILRRSRENREDAEHQLRLRRDPRILREARLGSSRMDRDYVWFLELAAAASAALALAYIFGAAIARDAGWWRGLFS